MKIAATYQNGEIFQHFGHTEFFKIYETEGDKIVCSEVLSSGGAGHGALAGFLRAQGVGVLLCGGIGGGAVAALAEAGIRVYAGISGSADEAVSALLAGTLVSSGEANCTHHGHHDHCGEHGCGHDGCKGN